MFRRLHLGQSLGGIARHVAVVHIRTGCTGCPDIRVGRMAVRLSTSITRYEANSIQHETGG